MSVYIPSRLQLLRRGTAEQLVCRASRECRRLNKVVADVGGLRQTLFFKLDGWKD